jgi:opacity protein-like surface antigen
MKIVGKVKLLAVACIVVLSASAASAADGRAYFGINAGVFMPTDNKGTTNIGTADIEFDTGFTTSAYGGYEFGNGLRLEGELTYKQADMHIDKLMLGGIISNIDSDVSIFGTMANVFFDFKNSSPVTPYIGGGIGFASVYVGQGRLTNGVSIWEEDYDRVFAYQVGAGVGYNVTNNVTLDLGYRYFDTSDLKIYLYDAKFASHNVVAGARFKF